MQNDKLMEFVKNVGLPQNGSFVGESYVITLADSDEWSKVYNILDKSEYVDRDIEADLSSAEEYRSTFLADGFDVAIVGDFDTDEYTVIITEAKE